MASRVTGRSKLRRTLRRVDPEITSDIRQVVREGAQAIEADALSFVPVDEGDLARSIEYKIGRDGLTAVIGPGASAAEIKRRATGSAFGQIRRSGKRAGQRVNLSKANKQRYFQFLKGVWVEFGTKGNAARNIPPQPARPFMGPAWLANRPWLIGRAQKALRIALQRASRGR